MCELRGRGSLRWSELTGRGQAAIESSSTRKRRLQRPTKFTFRSNLLSCRPLTQGAFSKLPCLSHWERVAEGRVRGPWPIEPHSSVVWGCSLPLVDPPK